MKINETELEGLYALQGINSGLVIRPGKTVISINREKTVVGSLRFDDSFPIEAEIPNLSRFLSVISVFNNPEFEWKQEHVEITDMESRIVYPYRKDVVYPRPPMGIKDRSSKPLARFQIPADSMSFLLVDSDDYFDGTDLWLRMDSDPMLMITNADGEREAHYPITAEICQEVIMRLPLHRLDGLPVLDYHVSVYESAVFFDSPHNNLQFVIAPELVSAFEEAA